MLPVLLVCNFGKKLEKMFELTFIVCLSDP